MATAATSPNDLTRQQLDELDSLLQRMLSLPLSPPESFAPAAPVQSFAPPMPYTPPAPAFAPAAREAPPPAPAQSPASRMFTPPAPEPVEIPVPWKSMPAPAASPMPAPVQPAPVIERPAPAAKPKMPAPAPLVATAPAPVAPRSEPVPFLLAPFVALNAVLNWVLGLFGLPGRFLRSGFVKSLLGLAGLGLLAYTALKVGQIHGWVSLPEQLPWPR